MNLLLALRETDPRVIPSLSTHRQSCGRCGNACAITAATLSLAQSLEASVVCPECLTPEERHRMIGLVTREQVAEALRYRASRN